MQHCQRKAGWLGERRKAGNQAAKEASPRSDGTVCVTAVFLEFPAGQPLTVSCLNLFSGVKVYYSPYQVSAFALDLSRDELFTAILSAPFLAEWLCFNRSSTRSLRRLAPSHMA